MTGQAEIYFDIGYCTTFLEGGGHQLLQEIASICDDFPVENGKEGADYILFGSDWIMLGQQPRHQEYVARVEQAIAGGDERSYWKQPGRREKILGGNLSRFLRLPPA